MNTENMPKKSNTAWYIGAVVIVIIIIAVGVLAYQYSQPSSSPSPSPSPSPSASPSPSVSPSPSPSPSPSGTISVTIYAGETSTFYGFGNSASNITSPGPSLIFKVGQAVTVTFQNAGIMPHNWALVDAKSATANVLFSAQIGSASNGLAAGSSQSITFTPTQAGSYYYICQVDAHVSLGMWGTVTVNP